MKIHNLVSDMDLASKYLTKSFRRPRILVFLALVLIGSLIATESVIPKKHSEIIPDTKVQEARNEIFILGTVAESQIQPDPRYRPR